MLSAFKVVLFALISGVILTVGAAVVFMIWSPTWRAHFSPVGPSRRRAKEAFRRQVEQQRLAQQPIDQS